MIAAIAYKIAFYFTAVTVRRGTISVGGIQNFPAYFRYAFFSETYLLTRLPLDRILGKLRDVQEDVGEHYMQLPRSFCVLIRPEVYEHTNNTELEVCEQHMSNIEQYMAMVAMCELAAIEHGHVLGAWHPVSEHLHASLCWRCGAMVWVTRAGDGMRWRIGGKALEEECLKEGLCSMQDIEAPAPKAWDRLPLLI